MVKRIVLFSNDILNVIGVICLSVLIILNSTFLYVYCIFKYNICEQADMSGELLIENYNRMIAYFRNPFIHELYFKEIGMSENGRIHFKEVKDIFMVVALIAIIFIIKISISLIINRENALLKLNRCGNIILSIILLIGIMMSISFSKIFYYFHILFFNNDYWVFDSRTDPIINALPEDVFRVLLIGVIVILILFSALFKLLYRNSLNE